MSVLDSLNAELDRLSKRAPDLASGPVAAIAREMATQLDGSGGPTAKANAAKALMDCLALIEARAPAEQQEDRADRIRKRRHLRVARTAD
jgi:hypothetical protein